MHLYDVGMASMLAMELQSLANLSLTAFTPPRTAQHAKIMTQLKGLQKLISEHHWNEEIGIFANKFSAEYTGQCNASGIVTGSNCSSVDCCKDGWYNRISPTSFYPMQSGIATDAQATTMVEKWLTPKDRFCIAPEGDSAGNDAGCHWGLPSISASDPAFPPLGYWRGFVWGPQAQLTYWALQQYPHVPAVAKGRKALAKQMTAMGMNQWHLHHHVCENYNPGFTTMNKGSDCTGDHFYHCASHGLAWPAPRNNPPRGLSPLAAPRSHSPRGLLSHPPPRAAAQALPRCQTPGGGLTGFISLLEEGYYESPVA